MERTSYTTIKNNFLQLLLQEISLTRGSVHKLFSVDSVDDATYSWAVMDLNMEMDSSTRALSILDVEAFCPEKKTIGISVKTRQDNMNVIHVHWRGEIERILSSCSHYYNT